MLKKCIAITIALVMMFSLTATLSMATFTENLTVKFETGDGEVKDSSGFYYESCNGLLSKPWKTYVDDDTVTVAKGEGVDGTDALKVSSVSVTSKDYYRGAAVVTKALSVDDTTSAVLRYKVKFNEFNMPEKSGNIISLAAITTNVSEPSGDCVPLRVYRNNDTKNIYFLSEMNKSKSASLDCGKWYTVVVRVSGAKSTRNVNLYVLNENNEIHFSESGEVSHSTLIEENKEVYLWLAQVNNNMFAVQKDNSGNVKPMADFYIDDVSLTTYNSSQTVGIDANNTNIKNGDIDVAVNNSFSIAFDKEISADSSVSLYKTNDVNKTPVELKVSQKTFNSLTVTPEDNLTGNTSYTLDFTNVKSASEVGFDAANTITFTTVNNIQHLAEVEVKQVAGEAAVTIETDQAISPVASMFALYEETTKITKVDIEPVIEVLDTNKCKISYTGLTSGEDYTLDYSGLTSTEGNGFAEEEKATKIFTFTVPVPSEDLVIISDITVSSNKINTKIYSKNDITTDLYAAVYAYENGKVTNMLSVCRLVKQVLSTGNTPLEFTLDKAYPEAGMVKIFALENNTLVPMMLAAEKMLQVE